MRAADKSRIQILRIFHDGNNDQPLVAVRFFGEIEVLGQDGILAVRDAVFLQVSSLHLSGHDFQGSAARSSAPSTGELPLSERVTLPGLRFSKEYCAEAKHPCLGSSLRVDAKSVVILPCDV